MTLTAEQEATVIQHLLPRMGPNAKSGPCIGLASALVLSNDRLGWPDLLTKYLWPREPRPGYDPTYDGEEGWQLTPFPDQPTIQVLLRMTRSFDVSIAAHYGQPLFDREVCRHESFILLYDTADRESFLKLEARFKRVCERFSLVLPDKGCKFPLPVAVIAVSGSTTPGKEQQEGLKVTPEEGRDFAVRIGAIFTEMDDNQNGLKELVRLIYFKRLEAENLAITTKQ